MILSFLFWSFSIPTGWTRPRIILVGRLAFVYFRPNSHVRAPVQEKPHSAEESLDISFRLLGEIPLALYKRGRMCSMFFLRM